MNNHSNRNYYMHGNTQISGSDVGLKSIAENRACLTFVIERYFHPKVICDDPGGSCERLESTILLLSRNLKREDQLIDEAGYPDARAHKKEHDTIIRNLETLRRTLVCGRYDNDLVSEFVIKWVESHTKYFDAPLAEFLKEQGREHSSGGGI